MTMQQRGRGRPKGSGRDDSPVLNRVADLMVGDGTLKPTTAMKRVHPRAGEADIRRLQIKWKASGPTLMAEASKRAMTASAEAAVSSAPRTQMARPVDVAHAMREAFDGPTMRAIREAFDSPAMRAMREFNDSPTMRAMRELNDSPTMRAMREFQNSPTMRAMRELQNSPTMQAMRELQNSPALQVVQEFHQTMDRVRRLHGEG